MTVLTHMVVGGAAGSFVEGRAAAFGLGMILHVPLDVMPHYEFQRLGLEVALVASFFGAMVVTGNAGTGVFWGALGAVIPDAENLLWRVGIIPGEWKVFPGHNRRLWRWLPHGRPLGPEHAWWQVVLGGAAAAVIARRLLLS
ncbi:MAG: hypothetical protein GF400_01225 [Candidatus Eisenbacteria bacterium]|nr:hypothetical protein [Candidatus Eisenbacteria bacterium]